MAIARSIFTKAVVTGTTFTRAQSRSVFGAVPRLIPEDGEDGVSATVAIGTVTTLAPGSPATVANVGTATAAVFNFGIPEGDQGNPGVVQAVIAGSNISVDNTDPANPVISSTSAVSSVNGQTGVVVLTATDIGSTATGDVAAVTVQGAIAELASEKLALAGGTMTGPLITAASATGGAGFTITPGVTPTAAADGSIWYRSDHFAFMRVNGANRLFAFLEGSQTFSGTKTFSVPPIFATSTTSIASFRVPHGVAPSAPTNGDVWSESATGFWGRVNGTSVNFATAAGVAAAYQPLDSDLTSWAGVTRASGFDTFAATPSSANLRALLTDETGTGIAYFVGGALGTPSSATLTSATGLPISTGLTGAGTGVLTALGVNVGSAGAFVTFNGALGTPSSGTLTNATGLPVAGIVSSTSAALGVGSVELGHANDTTLSRGAAGFLAVEGNRVPSPASQVSGDILYRDTTEWARLAKGTAYQQLRMNSGATAPEWATAREVLTANRTYYVRTDGSDSNTGLVNNSGGAFLTIQKAVNVVLGTLDIVTYSVTIQVADGTYTGTIVAASPPIGSGSVTISGNLTTPANVLLNVTGICINAQNGGRIGIKGVKFQSSSIAVNAGPNGTIALESPLDFGACTGGHIQADFTGYISSANDYTISGAAPFHYNAVAAGQIVKAGSTITLTGTPAFSVAFALASDLGLLYTVSITFSGAATGVRYLASRNGDIFVNGGGASYFPGNSAGSTRTGGQYN